MRIAARLVCTLVGHRPSGGRATYDTTAESFVDVATTEYATCTRCGDVRPAPLTVVDSATAGRTPDGSNPGDEGESARDDERELEEDERAERESSENGCERHPREERDADGDCAVSTNR